MATALSIETRYYIRGVFGDGKKHSWLAKDGHMVEFFNPDLAYDSDRDVAEISKANMEARSDSFLYEEIQVVPVVITCAEFLSTI